MVCGKDTKLKFIVMGTRDVGESAMQCCERYTGR